MIWHSLDENRKELELQMSEGITLVVFKSEISLTDRVIQFDVADVS